jgi:predicted AlkP superfamily pyrophosphatase or phosphodiesterase
MDTLPTWVTEFNSKEKPNGYLDEVWNTLLPIETYTESAADNNRYENSLGGKPSPTFPYNLKQMRERYRTIGSEYQLIWVTPAGNSLLTEFAMEAIKYEELGQDDITDLINISYSTPDVAGHTFGPQSVEVEDIYLRLDQNISELLTYLDDNIGNDNYMLFLTSDHAATPVVTYLHDYKLPSGLIQRDDYEMQLTSYLNDKYGDNIWVEFFSGDQVYLNREAIDQKKRVDLKTIQLEAANFLIGLEGINSAVTADQLQFQHFTSGPKKMAQDGFYAKRSGDVILTFDPGYIWNTTPGRRVTNVKGTTHGTGYNYDTQVPMLWFGAGISNGYSTRKVKIIDIVPTLSMFLNLQQPSGATGDPLFEIIKDE